MGTEAVMIFSHFLMILLVGAYASGVGLQWHSPWNGLAPIVPGMDGSLYGGRSLNGHCDR